MHLVNSLRVYPETTPIPGEAPGIAWCIERLFITQATDTTTAALHCAYLPGIWAAPVPVGSLVAAAGAAAGAGALPAESGICAAAGVCAGSTEPSSTLPERGAAAPKLPK